MTNDAMRRPSGNTMNGCNFNPLTTSTTRKDLGPPSVLCHKYATFQRAAQGLWQGTATQSMCIGVRSRKLVTDAG